jgi:tetratricopeptide (TPR) repeat protein
MLCLRHFCYLLLVLLCITFDAPQVCGQAPGDISSIIKRADDLSNSGKVQEAFSLYQQAYRLDSSSVPVLFGLGHCYLQLKDLRNAYTFLNATVERSPNFYNALYERGMLYRQLKKYSNAVDDETKAIALLPKEAPAYIERGAALADSKRYDQAYSDLTRAISLQPENASAYGHRARVLTALGRHAAAVADLKKALSINRSDPEILEVQRQLGIASSSSASAVTSAHVASPRTSGVAADRVNISSLPAQARIFFDTDDSQRQIFVKAEINGRPIKLLFDTGAPEMTIGKDQLLALGLQPPSGPPDGQTGGSSNNRRQNFWEMRVAVKLGPIVQSEVPLCVLERNEADSLMGQEFFKDFTYTIDKGGKTILFTRKGTQTAAQNNNNYSVPFRFLEAGNRIVVAAEVNGHPCEMIFDTGNTASAVTMNNAIAKRLGISIPEGATVKTTVGVSGSGSCYEFPVSQVRLGPIDRRNINIDVGSNNMGMPLLGQNFWSEWQYSIDMDQKVIRFLHR